MRLLLRRALCGDRTLRVDTTASSNESLARVPTSTPMPRGGSYSHAGPGRDLFPFRLARLAGYLDREEGRSVWSWSNQSEQALTSDASIAARRHDTEPPVALLGNWLGFDDAG